MPEVVYADAGLAGVLDEEVDDEDTSRATRWATRPCAVGLCTVVAGWTAVTAAEYDTAMVRRRIVAVVSAAILSSVSACACSSTGSPPAGRPDDRAAPPQPSTTASSATAPPGGTTTARPARPDPASAGQLPAGDDTTVVRIVDGDTLVVAGDERVRLIGIDTPEVDRDECYADEATTHLATLVPPGTAVRLAYDAERHDRYGRTLAYVFRVDDGFHANLAMARDGYALQLTIPPNVAYGDALGDAVADARTAGRGLWGGACEAAVGSPAGAAGGATGPAAPGAAACDPAYPTLCIPPGAADLDCGDIAERRFPVLPPDPHGFDGGDGDGVGCETP